ncbi:U-box domain-containing protein 54 [Cardamine amara subsp. amara]|uniref:RING-type E3 ubiquitin transferase n=1 Tax=Cardamine amara subsp. amara TaxID=228776 RepID=A0ABD1BGE3_CARAN
MEDAIYVAVNQDVRESKKTLLWTLKDLQVKKLCLLHVHHPFSLTASSSGLDQSEIDAIQQSELNTSYDSLHKYRDICTNNGLSEEDVDISLNSGYDVGAGIVELIYQNNIKKLVMGAAADPHYSRGMSITSRKAEYVSQHAPNGCKMWFICKGKLIKTREGSFGLGNPSGSFQEFSISPQKPSKIRRKDEDETEPKEHSGQKQENEEDTKKGTKRNGSSKGESSPEPPEDYMCSITGCLLEDPHVAADGFTYEADAFRKWIRTGGRISPKTGQPLQNYNLTPNHTLRSIIQDWLAMNPNYHG